MRGFDARAADVIREICRKNAGWGDPGPGLRLARSGRWDSLALALARPCRCFTSRPSRAHSLHPCSWSGVTCSCACGSRDGAQ
ncbi:MAG: hypothetical protein HZT43_09320 [Exiguobacterium profundum]|nr:MAG: hypothetical protein HZT43_09320 [Exiguobacterium profundum]